jgi:outer membrane protein TolC
MFMVHPHNLKSWRLFFISLLIWVLDAGAATQAQPKPEPKEASDKAAAVKTLLKERHMLLSKIVAQVTTQYQAGVTDIARVVQAERDLLRASLELEEDLEKRIGLLREGEKTAKEIVALTEARFKAATTTQVDILQAKAVLLDVQIELLRAEGKVKPRK